MSISSLGDDIKIAVLALLCVLLPLESLTKGNDYKVQYYGGSLADVKAGSDVKLVITGDKIQITQGKSQVANIASSSVTEISYGQDVHRRVGTAVAVGVFTLGIGALTALSKSKKHFIGLTWSAGESKGGFAMQCSKNEYRGILAGLEGVTGKKAVDSEAFNVKN